MRALAEAENARRRAEESVEKAHKFGVESLPKTSCPCSTAWKRRSSSAKTPMIR